MEEYSLFGTLKDGDDYPMEKTCRQGHTSWRSTRNSKCSKCRKIRTTNKVEKS